MHQRHMSPWWLRGVLVLVQVLVLVLVLVQVLRLQGPEQAPVREPKQLALALRWHHRNRRLQ